MSPSIGDAVLAAASRALGATVASGPAAPVPSGLADSFCTV